ncbi:hypothetical protein KBZ07_11205 [Cyanobium sp. BA20m-14]|nr:hypothetical protein [Cyanobium sp. BA20m-14]
MKAAQVLFRLQVAQVLVPAGCAGGCESALPSLLTSTGVSWTERRLLGVGRVFLFDIQGWITLILGGLLALITLFSSYSHVHILSEIAALGLLSGGWSGPC